MIKQRQFWQKIALVPLIIGGLGLSAVSALAEAIAIRPEADYQTTVQGESGGTVDSGDCGYIPTRPNHVMNLSGDIESMSLELTVANSEEAQPTLLIVGPDGRFCIRAIEGKADSAGLWPAGRYEIYVGDRSGKKNDYIISINQ
ncbi:hypothetical protein PN462_21425 [Spirulina sp. CS-785/01]|uniref:hypothetical protein n=1 Tax=Spirulina sp. CS-785/01 TaxID=3021716 RepID=UPI00233029E7|nr:hypothetical protein [Spirulina sp. CS-785/01]MDB9315689.1 hypothetical protein [Spirulina sp. CS-785/01]